MFKQLGPTRVALLIVAVLGLTVWSYRNFSLPAEDAVSDKPVAEASGADRFAEAHPVDEAFRSADGVWIRYDDQGAGDQTLVFVHGWNCDRSYWQLQRDFLAERYRVVTVDLAGHGDSAADRTHWSIEAFSRDVQAVVEGLDLQNVTLVGHSMGGNVVVAAAAKLGPRLARVIAVDTLRAPDKALPPEMIRATLDNMDVDYSGTVAAIVRTMFVDGANTDVRDFVIRDMASSPPAVGRGALLALAAHNPMPQLAAIDVPMVLINSDYQPTDVTLLERTVANFEYVEMPGIGHFVMLEDPLTFTNHLLAALQ